MALGVCSAAVHDVPYVVSAVRFRVCAARAQRSLLPSQFCFAVGADFVWMPRGFLCSADHELRAVLISTCPSHVAATCSVSAVPEAYKKLGPCVWESLVRCLPRLRSAGLLDLLGDDVTNMFRMQRYAWSDGRYKLRQSTVAFGTISHIFSCEASGGRRQSLVQCLCRLKSTGLVDLIGR